MRLLVVATAVAALLPLARLGLGWMEYVRVIGRPLVATPPLGFDGVRWQMDSAITASFVLPGGPAHRAGIRTGDRLVRLDFQPVARATDVALATERATGTVQAYEVQRAGRTRTVDVPIVRAPTFLYPLSARLWAAAAWGFGLATLVHILALVTVLPLAVRSARARRSAWLIGAALAWVGGNLARIVWVTVGTPGAEASVARGLFDALTILAVAGWIAFPALLLRDDLLASRRVRAATRRTGWVLAVPPTVLGLGVVVATVRGHVGPLPPDAFVAPVVFYVCVYVAAATLLALRPRRWYADPADEARDDGWDDTARRSVWLRGGHAAVLVLAVAGAVYAWGVAPASRLQDSVAAGWFVTALQLFSALPVVLVSLGTLRFGPFDVVLARGLSYAALLTAVFAAVVGGYALLETLVPGGTGPVALGALVVGVLAVVQGLAPRVGRWSRSLVQGATGSEAWVRLERFGERVRSVLDADQLASEAALTIGHAFEPRSAVVFLRHPGEVGQPWIRAAYRPAPPTFSEDELNRVWSVLRSTGQVWARNDEINEAPLPARDAERLRRFGVALAVPVADGDGEAVGLFVLGRKTRRLGVYTLADVARLRGLAGQLALAAERLRLVEREKALVRQTAEAELVALRAQINPHFLFNALNTVAALIAEQPTQAEATVESLAGLFRDVLTASGRPFVSLADELRLVRRYLDVEQARFGAALGVEIDADSTALAHEVPAFAVQTLVENAVKHGIERKRGGGRVAVHASTRQESLVVVVADTGVGIPALFAAVPDASGAPGMRGDGDPADDLGPPAPTDAFFGVGLSNVAQRLQQLYPDGTARLHLTSSPDGTTATLTLPAP